MTASLKSSPLKNIQGSNWNHWNNSGIYEWNEALEVLDDSFFKNMVPMDYLRTQVGDIKE